MTTHLSHGLRKVRLGLGQMRLRRTPLDFPLLLFFLTLFLSLWLSYSARLALNKFWILMAALVVYYAVTAVPRRYALWIAATCGLLAAGLTIFFLTAGIWHRGLAFAGGFFPTFYRLLSLRLFWPLLLPHPNVVAGHIVMLLPYVMAVLLLARRDKRAKLGMGTAVCLVIALAGLLLTRSVGAWLSLLVGLAVWGLWPVSGQLVTLLPLPRRLLYSLLVVLMMAGGVVVVWLIINQGLPGGQTLADRLMLVNSAWRLVQDYSWFGSGLASFPALYAEYVQVVPNFYLIYSNFYLDILLELGPLGAIWLLAIWVGAAWLVGQALRRSLARPYPHRGDMYWLRWATLASLVIILVHGLVDNTLFGGLGTPLLFFTPAMAVLVSRHKVEVETLFFNKRWAWGTAVTLFLLVCLLVAFRRPVWADWQAYQGAQAMDRMLLVGWPSNQWHTTHQATMLVPARHYFEQSVGWHNHNRTAQQRLGMMAMWQRDWDTAVNHLQLAYAQDPAHRGVIKSLGYAYVWQGQPQKAYPLLIQIPEASAEMETYMAYWSKLNQPDLAEKAAAAFTYLNNTP